MVGGVLEGADVVARVLGNGRRRLIQSRIDVPQEMLDRFCGRRRRSGLVVPRPFRPGAPPTRYGKSAQVGDVRLEALEEGAGGGTVFGAKPGDVDADRLAIHHLPVAGDHHAIRGVGAAEHQGGERIAGT